MSIDVWQNLPKAQDNNETIEGAVDRLIVAHNDDVTAHLGENQSIQAHRQSEIADHLAESVVNDKIKYTSREFIAIVDPDSESDFATVFDAVVYARQQGGGKVYIPKGQHTIPQNFILPKNVDLEGDGIDQTILNTNFYSSGIYIENNQNREVLQLTECWKDIGNPLINLNGWQTMASIMQPGMDLYDTADLGTPIGKFASVENMYAINVTDWVGPDEWYGDLVVKIRGTFINGSPIVTVLDNVDIRKLLCNSAYTIKRNGYTADAYEMSAFNGIDQFQMTSNFVGTTGTYEILFYDIGKTKSEITDLTIRASATGSTDSAGILAGMNHNGFALRRCKILGYPEIIKVTGASNTGTPDIIDECEGEQETAISVGMVCESTIFTNCNFIVKGANKILFYRVDNCEFNNCKWAISNILNYYNLFANVVSTGKKTKFDNCYFYGLLHFVVSPQTNRKTFCIFNGCTFEKLVGGSALVVTERCVFIGNIVKFTAGYWLFPAGTTKNVFVGNLLEGTGLTDSGTANVVANNAT